MKRRGRREGDIGRFREVKGRYGASSSSLLKRRGRRKRRMGMHAAMT